MWNLPVQKRQSALRGCLHVELTIDSYGEVIDRFGLRLAVEPPYLLTPTARHVCRSACRSLSTSIWSLSGEQARPGFVCWTVREIG